MNNAKHGARLHFRPLRTVDVIRLSMRESQFFTIANFGADALTEEVNHNFMSEWIIDRELPEGYGIQEVSMQQLQYSVRPPSDSDLMSEEGSIDADSNGIDNNGSHGSRGDNASAGDADTELVQATEAQVEIAAEGDEEQEIFWMKGKMYQEPLAWIIG
jgi:hypothetical protein